jgi:ATP-dependent RNA helicase RhlE
MKKFSELGLSPNIVKKIENELEWANPTPIQEKAIPIALSGQDMVGIAQTGTGKTAAFLLPLIHKLGYQALKKPRALIFAPTKELAIQIGENFEQMNINETIKCVVLVGGVGMKNQLDAIEEGVDLVVATPGRFMDIYLKGSLDIKNVKNLILDEADRLMDMGFMPQLRKILEVIPNKRQNWLFSATYPEKVEELSYEFLEFPVKIEIEKESTPVDTVSQFYYSVNSRKTKVNLLEYLLADEERFNRVIVFVNTKENADYLFKYASRKMQGGAVVIHSNKSQSNRSSSLSDFETGQKRILVTTNVSARGLDIDSVSHVINFDLPIVIEDYVHRIGRTGRAFKVGEAISFANKAERKYLELYEKKIKLELKELDFPADVEQAPLPKDELIEIEREIDRLKKKENPDYKGAFHEKKAFVKPKSERKTNKKNYKKR